MDYDFNAATKHFAARTAFTTGPHELLGALQGKEDVVVVDVRFPTDFRKAHIPGAVNLPKGKWDKPTGLSRSRLNILYCYTPTCHLAAEAAAILAGLGYPVVEMEGGFTTWEANGYPVQTAVYVDEAA